MRLSARLRIDERIVLQYATLFCYRFIINRGCTICQPEKIDGALRTIIVAYGSITISLKRWDPFDEMVSMRDAMDRLFEESFVRGGTRPVGRDGGTVYRLPVDVYETGDLERPSESHAGTTVHRPEPRTT